MEWKKKKVRGRGEREMKDRETEGEWEIGDKGGGGRRQGRGEKGAESEGNRR